MKVFEFVVVKWKWGEWRKKTKRLHWFNFGLIFGLKGLHGGYIGV